jgi:hypothetical protein
VETFWWEALLKKISRQLEKGLAPMAVYEFLNVTLLIIFEAFLRSGFVWHRALGFQNFVPAVEA